MEDLLGRHLAKFGEVKAIEQLCENGRAHRNLWACTVESEGLGQLAKCSCKTACIVTAARWNCWSSARQTQNWN